MSFVTSGFRSLWIALALWLLSNSVQGELFRVATYNLESYLETATPTRAAKSEASRTKIRESILALRPDVLALQELGSMGALAELRDSLKRAGLDLQYWQFISARDTNIHLALLSRFPFKASRAHTNDNFLLNGRRFHVSRGFAEVEIEVNPKYSFTLIAAHLKSKRALAEADEADVRLEEAKLLRDKIDARLSADPKLNLIVLGDFNDTKDSASTRAIIGGGTSRLVDTRPGELNAADLAESGRRSENRLVTWTHYYSKEDSYGRIDYVLLSRGMAREWIPEQTYVLTCPGWGLASDHRPLVATFEATDK